jgi:hypothetical protein
MSKVTESVEVHQASREVGKAIVKLALSVKEHLKDGFQPGQDLPAIVGENLGGVLTAVVKASQVPAGVAEDLEAFVKAWSLSGTELALVFVPKPAVPAPAPLAAAALGESQPSA